MVNGEWKIRYYISGIRYWELGLSTIEIIPDDEFNPFLYYVKNLFLFKITFYSTVIYVILIPNT